MAPWLSSWSPLVIEPNFGIRQRASQPTSASFETGGSPWRWGRGREEGEKAGGRPDDPAPGPLRSADTWRRRTSGSRLRYGGPMSAGSFVTMTTDPSSFRVGDYGRRDECRLGRRRHLSPVRRTGYRARRW